MDNTGNFEQQFTQNVKSAATQPVYEAKLGSAPSGSKLPIVIAIALAAIVLVESIALIITLGNYFSLTNNSGTEEIEMDNAYQEDSDYVYNDNDELTAIKLTCEAPDGSYYVFDVNNKYEEHNSTSAIANSGTYKITHDKLISLSNGDKILYYDGFEIADGLTIYSCEGAITDSTTE